jgi:Uma2 family endonuclease
MSNRVLPIFRPEDSRRLVQSVPVPRRGEHRVVFSGMTWKDYLRFWKDAEEHGGFRASYLDGTIELMFPSYEHESGKSQFGSLVNAYCCENEIEFFERGSTTLQAEMKAAGKEPDESFCFGRNKKIPDLAVEVSITSGGIQTLEIYRRFRIPEVWIFGKGKLEVFVLERGIYKLVAQSRALPGIDLPLLVKCAQIESGLQARKKFLAGLRRGKQS